MHSINSNFVQVLAAFKKPLVAYVKGVVNGLGARLLPLFDVVWAKSDATFSANSQDYGEIIEGIALISSTDKIDYNAVSIITLLTRTSSIDLGTRILKC